MSQRWNDKMLKHISEIHEMERLRLKKYSYIRKRPKNGGDICSFKN